MQQSIWKGQTHGITGSENCLPNMKRRRKELPWTSTVLMLLYHL